MRKTTGIGLLLAGVLVMFGCAGLSGLDANPTVVRIATGQAVLRYVDAGETQTDKAQRRNDLEVVLNRTLDFIDSDLRASPDDVVRVFVSMVDWDSLSAADRALAVEGVQLIQLAIQERIRDGELPGDSVIFVRGIVSSALDYLQYL